MQELTIKRDKILMKQIKIKLNSNIKEVKGNLFKKSNIIKVRAGNAIKGKINFKKKIKQV